jgi:hypothetical protein
MIIVSEVMTFSPSVHDRVVELSHTLATETTGDRRHQYSTREHRL